MMSLFLPSYCRVTDQCVSVSGKSVVTVTHHTSGHLACLFSLLLLSVQIMPSVFTLAHTDTRMYWTQWVAVYSIGDSLSGATGHKPHSYTARHTI